MGRHGRNTIDLRVAKDAETYTNRMENLAMSIIRSLSPEYQKSSPTTIGTMVGNK